MGSALNADTNAVSIPDLDTDNHVNAPLVSVPNANSNAIRTLSTDSPAESHEVSYLLYSSSSLSSLLCFSSAAIVIVYPYAWFSTVIIRPYPTRSLLQASLRLVPVISVDICHMTQSSSLHSPYPKLIILPV